MQNTRQRRRKRENDENLKDKQAKAERAAGPEARKRQPTGGREKNLPGA